jgi:branched-chain amino acid transport system substrate-binding protein
VLTAAIKATGSTDSDKVAKYLHKKLRNYPGLTGTISFDDKGDRVGEVYRIYRVNAKA